MWYILLLFKVFINPGNRAIMIIYDRKSCESNENLFFPNNTFLLILLTHYLAHLDRLFFMRYEAHIFNISPSKLWVSFTN